MITIEKAIETLTDHSFYDVPLEKLEIHKALNLAIEAFKRIQSKRITMSYHPDDLLPGETK